MGYLFDDDEEEVNTETSEGIPTEEEELPDQVKADSEKVLQTEIGPNREELEPKNPSLADYMRVRDYGLDYVIGTRMPEDAEQRQRLYNAQFNQHNSLMQLWKAYKLGRFSGRKSASINPDEIKSQMEQEGIPKNRYSYFEDVTTQEQMDNAIQLYRQDEEDLRILKDTDLVEQVSTGLVTGIVDPLYWIPIGRALKFGSKAVKTAVEFSVFGGLDYSLRAMANNDFDVSLLARDTVASGIVGGLFGGAPGAVKYAGKLWNEAKDAVKGLLDPIATNWLERDASGNLKYVSEGSFGRQVQKIKPLFYSFWTGTPMRQMEFSGNEQVKELGKRLFRDRVSTDISGKITVEEAVNLNTGKELEIAEKIKDLRDAFIKETGENEEIFNIAVGKIVINGGNKLENIVNEKIYSAAKLYMDHQSEIIDEAIKYGVLPKNFYEEALKTDRLVIDPKTAKLIDNMSEKELREAVKTEVLKLDNSTALGHIQREYDTNVVAERSEELRKLLRKEVIINDPEVSEQQINNIIEPIMAKLSGSSVDIQNTALEAVPFKAKLVNREIAIHDEILLERGFLKFDPVTNAVGSMQKIVAETELNKVAQSLGYKSFEELEKSLETSSNLRIGTMVGKESEQIIEANQIADNYILQLVRDSADLLRGTFTKRGIFKNHRVLEMARNSRAVQFAMTAGQLALSMLPDVGMVAMKTGTGRLLKRIFPRNRLKKEDKKTLTKYLYYLERGIQNNRFMDLGVPSEEKFAAVSRWASKWTGVDLWNKNLKEIVGQEMYSDLINACLKGDEKALRQFGVSESQKEIIAGYFEKYGYKDKGILYFDPNVIEDEALNRQIRASIQTLTDQTILTAGKGDVPRFLRSSIGQLLFMYKSYPFLVTQHVIAPFLKGDISKSRFAQMAAISLGLSAVRTYIVDLLNDRDSDPESPEFWKTTIEYSGIDNHFLDTIFSTYDVLSSRRSVSAQFSSTTSWLDNLVALFKGQLSPRQIRNMMPGLNFWYLRPLTNDLFPAKKRSQFKY